MAGPACGSLVQSLSRDPCLCRYEEDGLQRQSAAETKHLVNLPLDPQLLDTVVAFLYQTLHILFLPPLIGTFACTPVDPDKVRTADGLPLRLPEPEQ